MTQITINIEDKKIVPHIKAILKAIEGVTLTVNRKSRKPKDITPLIEKGLREVKMIEEGKLTPKSIDQLLNEL